MSKKVWVCTRCRQKKSVRKTLEDAPSPKPNTMEFHERCEGLCDLGCGRRSTDLWPMIPRSLLEQVAEAAKEPEIEARSVTTKDHWGVTRVVGGFGDVGGD